VGVDLSTFDRDQPSTGSTLGGTQSSSNFHGQLGHRWYRATAGGDRSRLRTILGVGLTGSATRNDYGDQEAELWSAGAYGEFGATWFFTRHLSLGGVSQLQAAKGREHITSVALQPDQTRTLERATADTWSVSLNLVRVLAAVYF
jgi:hypothetical protein